MDRKAIELEVESVSYKEGWDFQLVDHPEGLMLRIMTAQPDWTNPGEPTHLGINTFIPPILRPEDFHHWLLWRLGRIEWHEACEAYKVDGETFCDPHSDDYFD